MSTSLFFVTAYLSIILLFNTLLFDRAILTPNALASANTTLTQEQARAPLVTPLSTFYQPSVEVVILAVAIVMAVQEVHHPHHLLKM